MGAAGASVGASATTAGKATHGSSVFNADNPRSLQGRQHPVRRDPEQGRLPLSAAAHHRAVGRRRAGDQQAAAAGAAGDAAEHVRLRGVLAHEPGARVLRDGRLPGAHADRHHRPAHPPAEVGPDDDRRCGQRLELRGRHACRPARSASASTRSTSGTSSASATAMRPSRRPQPRQAGRSWCRWSARRARAGWPAVQVPELAASAHPYFGQFGPRRLDGRAHDAAALVRRPGRQHRRRRPRPRHHLHARPLRTVDSPADRPVRDGADAARGIDVGAQRDRHAARLRPGHGHRRRRAQDGGPTSWQAAILPPAVAPSGVTTQPDQVGAFREFYFEFATSSTPTRPASTSAPMPTACRFRR